MSADRFTLSSLPTFGEPVTLLVGLEDGPDGTLNAYLGSRHKGIYLSVSEPEAQETFRRAWNRGGHVWMWPVPTAEELVTDGQLDLLDDEAAS